MINWPIFIISLQGSVMMVDGDLYPPSSSSCDPEKRCCCSQAFRPCRTKYNPLPEDPSLWQRIKFGAMCPPHGPFAVIITQTCLIFLLWAVLFSILGNLALPGGHIFALYVLVVASMVAGTLVQKIFRLPPLLGTVKVSPHKYFCSHYSEV